MLARIATLTLLLALGGCALFEPEPPPPPPPLPPPPKPAEAPRIESQPLKHLANRDLKPMPIRPLNVKTQCTFRDEVTGTRGKLDLQVKEDEVKRFTAEVNIPKRGICRFDIKDFGQVKSQHPVTLTSRNGNACAVRMWEQGKEVTIAFNSCPKACEGEAFNYLWPILVDAKTGRCT